MNCARFLDWLFVVFIVLAETAFSWPKLRFNNIVPPGHILNGDYFFCLRSLSCVFMKLLTLYKF
jgi:hypothetical protein